MVNIQKMEDVRTFLGAMKVEQKEDMVYIRFRKSKTNKIYADQLYEVMDLEEGKIERIGEYELLIDENQFNYIYECYRETFMNRSF